MVDRILEIAPATKILMMSGYSSAELQVKAQQRFNFIQKPFMPRDLLQKIRDALGTELTGKLKPTRLRYLAELMDQMARWRSPLRR